MVELLRRETGDQGHPSENSRGDEGAYEDEDRPSEFGAPPFDRATQSASYFQTNEGHSDAHHSDDKGGLYERHLVCAESKADNQIIDAQGSARDNEFPRIGRSSYIRGTLPGLDERIETRGDEESATQVGSC